MSLKIKTSWLSATGLGALLLAGSAVPPASAQVTIRFGRGERRLEGQRFTTMRQLAHHLNEAAQRAARGAGDTAQERSGRMRQRFLWAINDFARQTRSLHERLDQYGSSPWDVADEVAALDQRARQVSRQIRSANAFPETHQDWAEAVNALSLMNRSLRGQDVAVPSAERRGYQPFDEQDRYRDGRHVEGLSDSGDRDGFVTGTALREFRRLANSLDVETERAVSVAEQSPIQSDRGDRSLADLRAFAQRASDLNQSSGADVLNPREIGPVVGRLMDDARQNDRSMRASNVFPEVEWGASIRLLEQMASVVRYQ
jgi:hypothetical protein